jgi:gag-polypeptide of LTR copia-type
MEHMGLSKIEKLEGTSNWLQWRFQICNILRTQVHDGRNALGLINGTVKPPAALAEDANAEAVTRYNEAVMKYDKLDAIAITIMTTAMNRDICALIMMYNSAKEIWDKLLSIYERKSGQRLDLLISKLFNYREDSCDSIAQHVAKLESLWFELCQEVLTNEHVQLPLSFLLNRILNTLPNDYFEFKSVWESKPYDRRTVKTLTEELCLLEQRLKHDTTGSTNSNVALVTVKRDSSKASKNTTAGN